MPERPQRELRELTRYRRRLIEERATAVNRLQKTLEGANIKLGAVATDINFILGTTTAIPDAGLTAIARVERRRAQLEGRVEHPVGDAVESEE